MKHGTCLEHAATAVLFGCKYFPCRISSTSHMGGKVCFSSSSLHWSLWKLDWAQCSDRDTWIRIPGMEVWVSPVYWGRAGSLQIEFYIWLSGDHIRWWPIEGLELERTFQGYLVLPFYSEQEHFCLNKVGQRPIQPDLECSQWWDIYHVCGQPVPVFYHLHFKMFLPYVYWISSLLVRNHHPLSCYSKLCWKFYLCFSWRPLLSSERTQ